MPANPKITEQLVERLSYIQHTHYGGFWDFAANLAKHDTAYTNIHLPCHSDGTYWTCTPGLVLFHLLRHEGEGGEAMLADSFKAVVTLKQRPPTPMSCCLAGECLNIVLEKMNPFHQRNQCLYSHLTKYG